MIATITYTRRPLRIRLAAPLMVWLLRNEIKSAERYADHALTGGVLTSAEVAQLLAAIGPLRVRLSLWEKS